MHQFAPVPEEGSEEILDSPPASGTIVYLPGRKQDEIPHVPNTGEDTSTAGGGFFTETDTALNTETEPEDATALNPATGNLGIQLEPLEPLNVGMIWDGCGDLKEKAEESPTNRFKFPS